MHTLPDSRPPCFPYTTDMPLLTRWGTPLLVGPGSIHVAHTDDEHVSIDELHAAVGIYESLAQASAAVASCSVGRVLLCRPAAQPYDKLTVWVSRTAARTLCNFSLRTASGPEGSSAKQTLQCAEVHRVAVGLTQSTPNLQIPTSNPSDSEGMLGLGSWTSGVADVEWPIRSSPANGGRRRSTTSSGRQAVTRTLRNAIASSRIAHAFVFAGSRGCGKTTTARILARALNCVNGPTADPCGECDACVEIAQGRDIDVLEIDAASHTGIDNIREVVISGLVDFARPRPLQDLHHRRGPSALDGRRSTRC